MSMTVTTCLVVMVCQVVSTISSGKHPLHLLDLENTFSLASMAMMLLGDQEPKVTELARALCHHSQDLEADTCSKLLNQFLDLRIANLAYQSASQFGKDL